MAGDGEEGAGAPCAGGLAGVRRAELSRPRPGSDRLVPAPPRRLPGPASVHTPGGSPGPLCPHLGSKATQARHGDRGVHRDVHTPVPPGHAQHALLSRARGQRASRAAGTACAGGGGGLTGQWGSGRTWSCRGRWAGGRSSSRPRPPPPSSHLLGFPGPRCHLKGHRAATSGRSTRQAPVTWASPRQQILTQLQPTAQCTRPGKGAWMRAQGHTPDHAWVSRGRE